VKKSYLQIKLFKNNFSAKKKKHIKVIAILNEKIERINWQIIVAIADKRD